jgi:hypothetical protein
VGSNFATELAEMDLGLSMEDSIAMHLQGNHYPPVPRSMVKPCMDAIDAYWEEDLNRMIELPEGVSWRGEITAPAYAIIEAHHLDAWCREDEYLDEEELV